MGSSPTAALPGPLRTVPKPSAASLICGDSLSYHALAFPGKLIFELFYRLLSSNDEPVVNPPFFQQSESFSVAAKLR
jgi:hypothetical protein